MPLTVLTSMRNCILVLSAILVAAGLAACGSGAADEVAVRVGSTRITAAAVAHWMSVIAGEVSITSGQPEPRVPVPPEYSACIAYKRKYPVAATSGRSKPTSELKRECELEFEKEKLKALYWLISSAWVNGEAAELAVNLSNGALKRELALAERTFPNEAAARRFLVGTRGNSQDLSSRLTQVVLATRIQQKLERQAQQRRLTLQQRQQALDEFGTRFERTWRARTSCRPDYVVPVCRQHGLPEVAPTLVPPAVPLTRMNAQ